MLRMDRYGGWTADNRQANKRAAAFFGTQPATGSSRKVIVERARGETAPDVIIGTGATVDGHFARLREAAAKTAEAKLFEEIGAMGHVTIAGLEAVAERLEQHSDASHLLGAQAVTSVVKPIPELIGAAS